MESDIVRLRAEALAHGVASVTAPLITRAQLEHFAHTSIGMSGYEGYTSLAARLSEKAPGNTAKRTFFVNSGAEAVQDAVKTAPCTTGCPGTVVALPTLLTAAPIRPRV